METGPEKGKHHWAGKRWWGGGWGAKGMTPLRQVFGTELPQGPGWEGTATLRTWCCSPLCCGSPAMDALVAEHVLTPPEALATLPACEGPSARVRLTVAHQVLAPVEGLAALAACVWLLARRQGAQRRPRAARVGATVASQVLLAPECLAALRARVRLLA